MGKKQYLVLTVCGDEHSILRDADYAVIEMKKFRLLAMMNLVKETARNLSKTNLIEMVFGDYIKFISRETLENAVENNLGDTFDALDKGEIAIVEVEDLSNAEEERVGTVGMYVTADSVHWEAVPKHCDFSLETGFVRRDDLVIIQRAKAYRTG
jgi:hypothetical protein